MSPDAEPAAELAGPGDQSLPEETGPTESAGSWTELRAEFHRSPLPPPEDLRAYEDILPGAAERIVALAERNLDLKERQLHGEERTQEQIHSETMTHLVAVHKSEKQGQWMAFILGCVILGVSYGLIVTGATVAMIAGVAGLVSALSGLAVAFVTTTLGNRRRRSRSEQQEADLLPQLPQERPPSGHTDS